MSFLRDNKVILLTFLAVLLYLVGFYTLGHDPASYVVNAILLGIGVGVLITWFSAAMVALANRIRTPSNKIVLAIWAMFFLLGLQRIIAIFDLTGMHPVWIELGPYSGIVTTLFCVMASYILLAPAQENTPSRPSIVWIVVGSAIGGMVVGILLTVFGQQLVLAMGNPFF